MRIHSSLALTCALVAGFTAAALSAEYMEKNERQKARAYSPGVITEGGRIVWLAGQTALQDDHGKDLAGNFEGQARQIFHLIDQTLNKAGGGVASLVTMTVFINDPRNGDRLTEIRKVVISATNNVPIRVEHVVEGGPIHPEEDDGTQGVVVGFHTPQGRIGICQPQLGPDGREIRDANGKRVLVDEPHKVQAVILLRKGEKSLPVLEAVAAKIREFNTEQGKLLPGVR